MYDDTPVHQQVLDAAARVADRQRRFRMRDVVAALPHLNPGTVRTHIASRCCVNSAAHDQTRWPYFRSLGKGVYRLEGPVTRRAAATRMRGWQDRIIESGDVGIDPTLITASLLRAPTERLEHLLAFVDFIESTRAANAAKLPRALRSTR